MIIFIYGEDTFRSREKLKELKEKFIEKADPSGNSIVCINGETTSIEKVNEATAAHSLFSRKRLIIIENIFSNKSKELINQVAEYINNKLTAEKKDKKKSAVGDSTSEKEDNVIIFWDDISGEKMGRNKLFTLLSKTDYCQNFELMSNTQTITWIRKKAKAKGINIRQQAAVRLSSLFGSDLWQIGNEINKLANYKLGRTSQLIKGQTEVLIEVNDVDQLARGNYDENIFALTDAISNKNKNQALALFENEIAAGAAESYLMHMIIRQFRILVQIRQSLDLGHTSRKIISQLRLHPYVVQKTMSQVRNFSLPVLKNIFSHLVEIDQKLKTGQVDIKTAINLLIVKL